jgi:hypothetical protein
VELVGRLQLALWSRPLGQPLRKPRSDHGNEEEVREAGDDQVADQVQPLGRVDLLLAAHRRQVVQDRGVDQHRQAKGRPQPGRTAQAPAQAVRPEALLDGHAREATCPV